MDSGSTTLTDLRRLAADKSAYVRLAAVRSEDAGWTLRSAHAVVAQKPPEWVAATWVYADAAFAAAELPADSLLGALEGATTLQVGSIDVAIPAVHENVNWQRQPSALRYDPAPLPWPTNDYDISRRDPQTSTHGPQGMMIGDHAPSFPDFQTAFGAFMYGRDSNMGAPGGITDSVRLRLVRTDAWLAHVHVGRSDVSVRIQGTNFAGARLELNGSGLRIARTVGKLGRVQMRLPRGLPDDAWLYLSRNGHWLDYRVTGASLYGIYHPPGAAVDGVSWDPPDMSSRVEALATAGEGPRLEYKSELPPPKASPDSKRKVFKTIAAFANADGGTLMFGISPDETTVIGVGTADDKTRDHIGDLVRQLVVPTPHFEVHIAQISGRTVVVLDVAPGTDKPYGIQFGGKPVEFYVRRGASTFPATQAEVRAAALSTAGPARLG